MQRLVGWWRAPGAKERRDLRASIAQDAGLDANFIALTLAACAIATFGLLENNVAAIIGAMIIAPLMLPIESFAFGAVSGNLRILRVALIAVAAGTVASVLLAALLARVVYLPTLGSEVLARSQPNLLDLGVALAAGFVAAFAKIRPSIAGTSAGTAIAVARMPPLCVVGIAIAHGMMELARGAALLYVTNLLGIMLASMAMFVASRHVHISRARHGLVWTGLAVAAILIPLAASTGSLIRQARVESDLREALLNGTVTFSRVDLIATHFDWVASPPKVTLLVRSAAPITPEQVRLLEAFARRKTGMEFKFIFEVTPVNEVQDVPAQPTSPPIVPGVPVQ